MALLVPLIFPEKWKRPFFDRQVSVTEFSIPLVDCKTTMDASATDPVT